MRKHYVRQLPRNSGTAPNEAGVSGGIKGEHLAGKPPSPLTSPSRKHLLRPLDHRPASTLRIIHLKQPTTDVPLFQIRIPTSLRPIFTPLRNRFGRAQKTSPPYALNTSYADDLDYAITPPKRQDTDDHLEVSICPGVVPRDHLVDVPDILPKSYQYNGLQQPNQRAGRPDRPRQIVRSEPDSLMAESARTPDSRDAGFFRCAARSARVS